MDLFYIIKEFEEFYEMKYSRPPLMVKKLKNQPSRRGSRKGLLQPLNKK